jgi:DNA-binding transcriptional MerR regulator
VPLRASLITEFYPQDIFLPIETNGDGAVNVYSRVQMQLFNAKQLAQKEVDKALADVGMTIEEVRAFIAKHPTMGSAFHRSPHRVGCTAADLVYEVGARKNQGLRNLGQRLVNRITGKPQTAQTGDNGKKNHAEAHLKLMEVARRAATKARKKSSIVSVALRAAGSRSRREVDPP